MNKNFIFGMIVALLFQLIFPFFSIFTVSAETTIIVTAKYDHTPGYHWCQNPDDKRWATNSALDGNRSADNVPGTKGGPDEPAKTRVKDFANLTPPTANWKDEQGKSVNFSDIKNTKPISVSMAANADPSIEGVPTIKNDQVIIEGYSGKGVYGYSQACGANTGSMYPFPITVTWQGEITVSDPQPPTGSITGDFDILPSQTINFKDQYILQPKNITDDPSCRYLYHEYKYERDGNTWISPKIYNKTASNAYNYGNYPWIIGIGYHDISIRVTGTCGDSGWINDKGLTVNGPANNSPPDFKVAWVIPGTQIPVTTALVGEKLDLIYLDDSVSDPENDTVYWLGFDMAGSTSSFVQGIPSKYAEYTNGWHNITMDTVGVHRVSGSMRDVWGASATRFTWVDVVTPDPVPVIAQSGTLKENRRIRLDASASYSPYSGRSIDFNKTTWKIEPVPGQTQGTLQDICYMGTLTGRIKDFAVSVKGQYKITLTVYDSAGLSGSTSQIINVNPDLPPVPVLDGPTLALRDPISKFTLTDNSYSPDGDILTDRIWHVIYDANNDGVYDEPETRIDINTLVLNQEETFTVSGQTIKIKKISAKLYELRATNVGKINIRYELHETPGQPTSLEY